MPKRLSALAFTPSSSSNTTIITADKTGEVYGLPLLPAAADDETPPRPETLSRHAQLRARDGPEASTTTVHSQRNRQALEAQQRSAGKPTPRRVDDEVSRKYELQLGHVSIVTDVLFATAPSPSGGRRRGYIITADKDEHIRVSRAPPQAYVAEGFCLGHKRFVSRLCLAEEEVLASAGGEDDVFGWRWREGKLAGRVGIAGAVGEVRRRLGGKEEAEEIAVSGLWRMDGCGKDGQARMLVTVEGVPAAFYFPVSALTTAVDEPQTAEYVLLPGNPLDLVCHGDTIVVSLDNVHAPGSTTVVAEGTVRPSSDYGLES
jgi:tRNA (guanine-N(7)-)-methyltransferase subunit TRM82